ncbi:MAG: hypothetical protein J1E38_06485 [Paramuribaculum sp.]|nr:hypothetical protein [Paramuribaculum sp.]
MKLNLSLPKKRGGGTDKILNSTQNINMFTEKTNDMKVIDCNHNIFLLSNHLFLNRELKTTGYTSKIKRIGNKAKIHNIISKKNVMTVRMVEVKHPVTNVAKKFLSFRHSIILLKINDNLLLYKHEIKTNKIKKTAVEIEIIFTEGSR